MFATAHAVAYEKAGILHRDVSAGNILISGEGCGILIDWDLSKKVIKDIDEEPRQHSRTVGYRINTSTASQAKRNGYQGTWPFISIARLVEPRFRPHELSDDLESFFWVLLYQIAKCRNAHNINLSNDMQEVFDQHTDLDPDGIIRGGSGKIICLGGYYLGSIDVEGLVSTPCKDIIEELRSLFRDLYLHVPSRPVMNSQVQSRIETRRELDPRVKDAREKLCSSAWVLAVINGHLASRWDVDDGSLYKTRIRPVPSASRKRQKRKAADSDDGVAFNQRRKGRLPPSSTQLSGDSLAMQGNRSSFTGTKEQN